MIAFGRRSTLPLVSVIVTGALWASQAAAADGFDVGWFLTRAPASVDPASRVCLAGVLLALDYGLNFLVIALPARRQGVKLVTSARDLVGFTFLAQIADRLGMVACVFIVALAQLVLPGRTTMASFAASTRYMLALNFVTSGAMVWILAEYYLAERWHVRRRPALWIASAAAVVTNPAWAIGMAPLLGWVRR
jgi:hypothetical protein